jgi:hypothetical protein
MATNTYKLADKKEKIRNPDSSSLYSKIGKLVNVNELFVDGLPIQYLPKILFIACVMLFYIGNAHFADKKVRQIEKMKLDVEDIRADYTTLKADLMFASKQSEVAKKVSIIGLEESQNPPTKISVEE